MKRWNLFLSFCILCTCPLISQSAANFTATVSTDSVLMDNFFEVKFSLENGQGENFEPPAFSDFLVVGGPNQSSSFSMINGAVNQSMTFSFFLQPKEIGKYYIPPASIKVGGKILETDPITIWVLPNPDGIIQNRRKDNFQDSPFWKDSEGAPDQPAPAKKHRKIYKM